jgi:hypothetical protein
MMVKMGWTHGRNKKCLIISRRNRDHEQKWEGNIKMYSEEYVLIMWIVTLWS